MRNRNLSVRRNIRNNKQALVESIMTKIRPIVKKALNEGVLNDELPKDDIIDNVGLAKRRTIDAIKKLLFKYKAYIDCRMNAETAWAIANNVESPDAIFEMQLLDDNGNPIIAFPQDCRFRKVSEVLEMLDDEDADQWTGPNYDYNNYDESEWLNVRDIRVFMETGDLSFIDIDGVSFKKG